MAEDDEPVESRFIVCFLKLSGGQLTLIGPLAAIEELGAHLADAADVELHQFERPPPTDARARVNDA
jgi:hypothetical protein